MPTPGTLARRSASACQAGLLRIAAVDVAFEFGEFGLQQVEMPVDGLEDARLAGETTAVRLGHHHLDDLAAACHQFAERLRLGVGDGRAGGRIASAK